MDEHVTVVLPSDKAVPEAGVHAALEMPLASTALKIHDATAVGALPLVGVTISGDDVVYAGHANVGPANSELMTANVQVEVLLALSVALHVTVVVPSVVRVTGLASLQPDD